jgi:Leucine-rich repeat (LRR) protein
MANFKIRKHLLWGKIIVLKSGHIEEGLRYAEKKDIRIVELDHEEGFSDKNADFLIGLDFVEGVVVSASLRNMDWLAMKKNLRLLYVDSTVGNRLDLSDQTDLEMLYLMRCPQQVNGFGACLKLKHLTLGSYKPTGQDLADLPVLPQLQKLELHKSGITDLKGLDKLPQLMQLLGEGLPQLQTLDGIGEAVNLQTLELRNCKRVTSLDALQQVPLLARVKLPNCGQTPNLRFIKNIPHLRFFTFVDTNVLDGDMAPLVGVDYIGYSDKRHFSHRQEEIEAMSAQMRGGPPDPQYGYLFWNEGEVEIKL